MSEEQAKPKAIEHPERDPSQGFDRRVKITDARTGQVISYQPYEIHFVGDREYYERPLKSGNLWESSGKPAGRWVKVDGKWQADPTAAHVEVTEEVEVKSPEVLQTENEQLRAELAAMKAEAEGKGWRQKKN